MQNITPTNGNILSIESLNVEYTSPEGKVKAVRDFSLEITNGETIGIAGESGSGKSTLALAVLQYLGQNGQISSGEVKFKGESLKKASETKLRSLRGNEIAHVAQDASRALNPSLTIGEQISETIRKHQNASKSQAQKQTIEALKEVDIPDAEYNANKYPHELSGGQQQRVLIAIALSCNPDLLILDEPTTGLDVTTQTKIIDLIEDLKEDYDTTILLITHNLAVIAQITDRVGIMYAGELMEVGPVDQIFVNPTNPYTQSLLAATPELGSDTLPKKTSGTIPSLTDLPSGCVFADRCEFVTEECRSQSIELTETELSENHRTRCIRWEEVNQKPIRSDSGRSSEVEIGDTIFSANSVKKLFDKPSKVEKFLLNSPLKHIVDFEPPVKAVNDVDIDIHEGETIGLVGESGSGKSTLARTLLRLLNPEEGELNYKNENVSDFTSSELSNFYSECQIVFQNPHSSLNPRKSVRQIIDKPLRMFTDMDKEDRNERIQKILKQVDLGPGYTERYPHELSGGEKQRVAIGRAFAPSPSLIILDEPTSALDVSVQANILNLLSDLKEEYNTAYLFVSHNLGVVSNISDRIFVMYLGEIVENGTKSDIFNPPYHPYTRVLLSNIPTTDPSQKFDPIKMQGEMPSSREPPVGCSFHTRCPQKIGDVCESDKPNLESGDSTQTEFHCISCHLDSEDMDSRIRSIEQVSDSQ